ncbi:MAG: DNA polymerase-4 [Verrucomicrobiales bacterium]|jgi:DNA polymerase-4
MNPIARRMQAEAPAPKPEPLRKIIHIDMDCFYAAIEIREHPELRGRPVAVGGNSEGRGVLTTCNYEARKFGCHSAMPAFQALQRCPKLVLLPVRFELYRAVSHQVREIFAEFTELIEPLSLDEAFLDVSHLNSSATSIAQEIRYRIRETTLLTASAGIANNKMLAKIASDWNKPDGQFEVRRDEVAGFMEELSVRKLWGVGGKTAEKLATMGVQTCGQLQKFELAELARRLKGFGAELYQRCRGIDDRIVNPTRERKSVSNETTFREDLTSFEACLENLRPLFDELASDVERKHSARALHKAVVKVKFSDFTQTTAEKLAGELDFANYESLLAEAWQRGDGKSVRLLGAGVRFKPMDSPELPQQLEMF